MSGPEISAAQAFVHHVVDARREQSNPAFGHFFIGPGHGCTWIHVQYRVHVVTHDRIGVQPYRKAFR
ncbi:hypothetical protein EO087_05350 [Dyella sp. M7H15-1]|uniref:hypothetical protein n=1 Tax=Dyella sp. M7H15-1 TaxID=2501295 RepID=UPI001004E3A3|nr:hypothetical protein [Dyella sp. M7H15-1]QAU23476.1 hypothetical protein EO087_05350 [Dyella sp. M7H15-1]